MDSFERAIFLKEFGSLPNGFRVGDLDADSYFATLLQSQEQVFRMTNGTEPDEFIDQLLRSRSFPDFCSRLRSCDSRYRLWVPARLHQLAKRSAEGRPAAAALATFLAEAALDDYVPAARDRMPAAPSSGTSAADLISVVDGVEGLLPKFLRVRSAAGEEGGAALAAAAEFYDELQKSAKRTVQSAMEKQIALAFASADPIQRIKARLRWISFSRSSGRRRTADVHLRTLQRDLDALLATDVAEVDVLQQVAEAAAAVNVYDIALGAYLGAVRKLSESRGTLESLLRFAQLNTAAATCLYHLSSVSEALDLVESVLGLPWHQVLGSASRTQAHAQRAEVHRLAGMLYGELDDHRSAYNAFRAEARDAAAASDRQGEFVAYAYANTALMNMGVARKAVTACQQLVEWARRNPGPGLEASALNMLGQALGHTGDVTAAEKAHMEALRQVRESGVRSPQEYQSLFALGDIMARRGELQSAIDQYGEALEAAGRVGKDFDARLRLLNSLAAAPELVGPEFSALALSSFEDGMRMNNLLLLQCAAAVLTAVMSRVGDHAAAIALTRDVYEAAEQSAPLSRTTRLWRSRLVALLVEHGGGTGRQEAFQLCWNARTRFLADPAAQGMRGADTLADWFHQVIDSMIGLLVDGPNELDLPDDRDPVELAFDLHEEAKSLELVWRYADADLPRPAEMPPELFEQERRLLQERRALRTGRLDGAVLQMAVRGRRAAEIDRHLAVIWDGLQDSAPEYMRLRRAQPARLANVRAVLRAHATRPSLVSFFCGAKRTYTFVVSADGDVRLQWAAVPQMEIAEIVSRLRRTFDGDDDAFPPLAPLNGRKPWRRGLEFLSRLDELTAFVDGVDTDAPVLVAPDRPLHGIPLHALKRSATGRYVAEDVGLCYVPNGSSLLVLDPALDDRVARGARLAFVGSVPTTVDDPAAFDDTEVLTDAGWSIITRPGVELTPAVVLETMRQQSIVHLTCHGWVSRREPLDGGLVLSDGTSLPPPDIGESPAPTRDPFLLTIRRLFSENLSVSVLTLRACSTARVSETSDPDERDSLVSALQLTGVRTVVAGLWDLDRDSSRRLLTDFYRRMASDSATPLWRVFWDTQRSMLGEPDDSPYRHPYHWAALMPFGDWR